MLRRFGSSVESKKREVLGWNHKLCSKSFHITKVVHYTVNLDIIHYIVP